MIAVFLILSFYDGNFGVYTSVIVLLKFPVSFTAKNRYVCGVVVCLQALLELFDTFAPIYSPNGGKIS
jgi:hypothetical protein